MTIEELRAILEAEVELAIEKTAILNNLPFVDVKRQAVKTEMETLLMHIAGTLAWVINVIDGGGVTTEIDTPGES
jgi:hypothetical protein